MGKKACKLVAVVCALVMTLVGCGGNGESKEPVSAPTNPIMVITQADAPGTATFPESWEEELALTSDDGENFKLVVKAQIKMPEAPEELAITEYAIPEFTEEYKSKVIEALFGNRTMYYYDLEHYPKSLLERQINDCEDSIAYFRDLLNSVSESERENIEQTMSDLESYIDQVNELLPNAPEDYVEATDYSTKAYISFINAEGKDDITMIHFNEPGAGILTSWVKYDKGEYMAVSADTDYTKDLDRTRKQFIELAEVFGLLDDPSEFDKAYVYDDSRSEWFVEKAEIELEAEGAAMGAWFSHGELIDATATMKLELLSENKNVSLIDFEEVKKTVINNIKENSERYPKNNFGMVRIDSIEFERYQDCSEDGKTITYYPAWKIQTEYGNNTLYISAIDGKILWEGDAEGRQV